jgi:hypothetical protein
MSPEQRRARATERLKMTQAEKWLSKMSPKPNAATLAQVPFNEQLRSKRAKIGGV